MSLLCDMTIITCHFGLPREPTADFPYNAAKR